MPISLSFLRAENVIVHPTQAHIELDVLPTGGGKLIASPLSHADEGGESDSDQSIKQAYETRGDKSSVEKHDAELDDTHELIMQNKSDLQLAVL